MDEIDDPISEFIVSQRVTVYTYWERPNWALPRQCVCHNCKNTVKMPSFDPGGYAEYPFCPWCGAMVKRRFER